MVELATIGPLTLDLSAVTFLDSAGLGLIVGLHERSTAVGLVVIGASAAIRASFVATGLDQVLRVADEARSTGSPSARSMFHVCWHHDGDHRACRDAPQVERGVRARSGR